MQEEVLVNKKTKLAKLALAIAQGESIAVWARKNGVPRSSAFRWAKDPKVTRAIEAWRRRSLNRAIGRMVCLATKAVDGIARLAKRAESESVQLRAWRALLADQMAVAKFSSLEQRIVELEELASDRTGQPPFTA
jgi:hypothetical protein